MQPYYNKKIPELQHIIENGKYFFLTDVPPAKPHSLRFKFQLSELLDGCSQLPHTHVIARPFRAVAISRHAVMIWDHLS